MNDTKSALYVLLITFALHFIPGQFMSVASGQSFVFKPAEDNQAFLSSLSARATTTYNEELTRLPSKHTKDYEEIYKSRWENIKEVFDKKEIYTAVDAQAYMDAFVDEIVQSNPGLQQKTFRCFFSRSGVPNASYIGQGIILFNMGLFRQLNNESEVAFVLCHELAHFYLQHSENAINNYVVRMNSPEIQEALKKIKHSEFGKKEQVEKLIKGITFDSRRHTRDHEAQADSMALEFMRNTRFNKRSAVSLLNVLDNIDQDTLNTGQCLQQMFNTEKYPFRQKWIGRQTGLLGGHAVLDSNKELEDSLKTHPDCQKRIKLLEPLLGQHTENETVNIINGNKFDSLRQLFNYEIVEYAYRNDNYTLSLFYTVKLLLQSPNDAYLVTQVGKILNGCYDAQKQHILGKKIELPSPGNSTSYNMLLQFIQNLYLEDFAGISYHYLAARQHQYPQYSPFEAELRKSRQFAEQ